MPLSLLRNIRGCAQKSYVAIVQLFKMLHLMIETLIQKTRKGLLILYNNGYKTILKRL
nr:MAG TPA: hypothetical protein [Caudoviricetes sp.]